MPKKISFWISDEMAERIQQESERLQSTQTDIIVKGIEAYFKIPPPPNKREQNMQTVFDQFAKSHYENAKTRALVRIVGEKLGAQITDEDIDETEEIARAYVEEKKT